MEIELQNSKEDYGDFYKYFYFKRTIVYRIFFSLGIGILLFGGKYSERKYDLTQLQSENLPKILLVAAIIFVLITLLPYFIVLRRLASVVGTSKSPVGKKKFTTTERGIQVDSEIENVFWYWENVRTVGVNEQFIYLILYSHRAYILPTKYFSNEKDILSFVGAVQNSSIKVRGRSPQRKAWQLYWWGLLCLIPGVGAIAGFVLLLRGLIEFKDKILILIGVSGILISVYFYSQLIHDSNNYDFKKGWTNISQSELNYLMKEIEFYKIQNGTYPENLEQLQKNNPSVLIHDPLQSDSNKKWSKKFNYNKLGDKYYLFSSGIDGIPNTADDIYPTVLSTDSSKFGLIRK